MRSLEEMPHEIFDAVLMPDDPLTVGIGLMDCETVNKPDEWHEFEARFRHTMYLQAVERERIAQ